MKTDHTHDAGCSSWVPGATGHHEFPLQNLPLGILDEGHGRIIVAIGDYVLDVVAALDLGYLDALDHPAQLALRSSRLNAWMQLSAQTRLEIRHALFGLLEQNSAARQNEQHILRKRAECPMTLPADIGDYTDFYCGIHHAMKAGALFRPDNPLLPNYRHLPIAYHGRSSSIMPSGQPVHRPRGQIQRGQGPVLQFSERMDFELELGIWVGPGTQQGTSIPLEQASNHIAGYCLFNDWSARDIQAWEYRPLGPFQGKNFASSVSPWVITADALAPFRQPAMERAADDPPLLDYLHNSQDQTQGGLDIQLDVSVSSALMREQGLDAVIISRSHACHLYWTPAQMLTHHTLGGCNLKSGDLMATGTISTPDDTGNGSLLELTQGGKVAFTLPTGERRTFLEDGDEVVFTAYCVNDSLYRIGFGECRGQVVIPE